MAMEAEYHRQHGDEVFWENLPHFWEDKKLEKQNLPLVDKIITEPEGLPFLSLPHPDRVFTRAKEYTSGNYKYLPGTHIQAANGCWHGQCSFCVEKGKPYEVRPVEDVIEEIKEIKRLGFREVFDDSGTFPTGRWLDEFITNIEHNSFNLSFGCNFRAVDEDYKRMKQAGFRMLLFGLESANQYTLDMVNKGVKVEDVKYIIKAAKAGLEPHVAVMFGYPWETDKDAQNTLALVHWLLRKGYAKTAQASVYRPNPDEKVLYDKSAGRYVRRIYNVGYSLEFWFNQLKDIRNTDDLKYLWRKIKAGLGL